MGPVIERPILGRPVRVVPGPAVFDLSGPRIAESPSDGGSILSDFGFAHTEDSQPGPVGCLVRWSRPGSGSRLAGRWLGGAPWVPSGRGDIDPLSVDDPVDREPLEAHSDQPRGRS